MGHNNNKGVCVALAPTHNIIYKCTPPCNNVPGEIVSFDSVAKERTGKCGDAIRHTVLVSSSAKFPSSDPSFSDSATQTSSKFAPIGVAPLSRGELQNLKEVSVVHHSIEHMSQQSDLKDARSTFIVIGHNREAQRHCCKSQNSLCHYGISINNLNAIRLNAKIFNNKQHNRIRNGPDDL